MGTLRAGYVQQLTSMVESESSTVARPVPDGGSLCPGCQGRGSVRQWPIFLVVLAIACLGLSFYLIYQAVTQGPDGQINLKFIVLAICLLVFGLYPLLDRSECKQCGGMGTLEPDGDDEDDPDAEWAQAEPPQ